MIYGSIRQAPAPDPFQQERGRIADMNPDSYEKRNESAPTSSTQPQDSEAPSTPGDHLRWELSLLLGIYHTQERYVALLRTNQGIDAQYLASEEAFLARLEERVEQTQAALEKTGESV